MRGVVFAITNMRDSALPLFLPLLSEHLPLYLAEALLFLLPIFLSVLGERDILALKKL